MNRRIGVLVTNTDETDFAKSHPLDDEKFRTLLNSVRPDWTIVPYWVKDGKFPETVAACDGYVITGSPASVNGRAAWIEQLMDFIRQLDREKIPTVGCCFGHQAIAKALGGTVSKNPKGWGWGVAATHFDKTESWMVPTQKDLRLFAAHTEQVTTLPKGAVALGGDDFCPIGSFRVGQHFFTTEYHPEITPAFFLGLCEAFETYVGADVAAKGKAQATENVDSAVFAEWMARFLEMRRTET